MKIFSISDPHFGRDMSRFGEIWIDHEKVIARNWTRIVSQNDLVLIPGDFSWGTTTKSVQRHLDLVNMLPGRCIISPGNHDRWWKKTERLRYADVRFLADAHMSLGEDWTLAATMGWDTTESPWWKEADRPVLESALTRLDETLVRASEERPDTKILLMIHYPPRWARESTPTVFEEVIARHPVDLVVYGHIHGVDLTMAWNESFELGGRSVRYENMSCDHVRCEPKLLMDLPDVPLPF